MFVLHIILHLPLSPAGEYWKHFRGRPCLLSWQLYSVSFVVWLDHKYLGNQASVGSHLKVFQYCYAFTKKKKKCLHKHPFIAASVVALLPPQAPRSTIPGLWLCVWLCVDRDANRLQVGCARFHPHPQCGREPISVALPAWRLSTFTKFNTKAFLLTIFVIN